jgi:hypothetical protein
MIRNTYGKRARPAVESDEQSTAILNGALPADLLSRMIEEEHPEDEEDDESSEEGDFTFTSTGKRRRAGVSTGNKSQTGPALAGSNKLVSSYALHASGHSTLRVDDMHYHLVRRCCL